MPYHRRQSWEEMHPTSLMSQCKLVPVHPCFWWTSKMGLLAAGSGRGELGAEASLSSLGSCLSLWLLLFSLSFLWRDFFCLLHTQPILRALGCKATEASTAYWLNFQSTVSEMWSSIVPFSVKLYEILSSLLPCFKFFMTLRIYFFIICLPIWM